MRHLIFVFGLVACSSEEPCSVGDAGAAVDLAPSPCPVVDLAPTQPADLAPALDLVTASPAPDLASPPDLAEPVDLNKDECASSADCHPGEGRPAAICVREVVCDGADESGLCNQSLTYPQRMSCARVVYTDADMASYAQIIVDRDVPYAGFITWSQDVTRLIGSGRTVGDPVHGGSGSPFLIWFFY